MWQAIKKFRQAYLDAKGDRLHAEAEASRHALCQSAMSVEEVQRTFEINSFEDPLKQELKKWAQAASEAMEDERNRERYY